MKIETSQEITKIPKIGTDHRALLNRLKRIEGQLKTITRNVEDQKYCIGIIYQVKSIRSALKSLELEFIKGHLNGCVRKSLENQNEGDLDTKIEEIISLFEKAHKL